MPVVGPNTRDSGSPVWGTAQASSLLTAPLPTLGPTLTPICVVLGPYFEKHCFTPNHTNDNFSNLATHQPLLFLQVLTHLIFTTNTEFNTLISPIFSGPERLSNLLNITELVSGRAGI